MEKFFPRENMSLEEYADSVNRWLFEHKGINPTRLCVGEFCEESADKKSSAELTLEYSESSAEVDFGFAYFEKESCLKLGLDVMKDEWQRLNQGAKIILCAFAHGVDRLSPWVKVYSEDAPNCNRLWILYSKNDEGSAVKAVTVLKEFTDEPQLAVNPDINEFEEVKQEAPSFADNKAVKEPARVYKHNFSAVTGKPMIERFCLHCGTKNEAGAAFCSNCGAAIIY